VSARVHVVKSWPKYFTSTIKGVKSFEVRYDDRGYREGDALHLQEFDPERRAYTGRQVTADIVHVMPMEPLGFGAGYVVLGLGPLRDIVL
jgi:ParB family chromosome partitioning protein